MALHRSRVSHAFAAAQVPDGHTNDSRSAHGDQLRLESRSFPLAVRAGSRIRARIVLQSIRDVADAAEATYSITVECQDAEKPCCVAELLARYYMR